MRIRLTQPTSLSWNWGLSEFGNIEDENTEDDLINSLISDYPFESYQHVEAAECDKAHDLTTIFMNKFCEDPNLPSVANELAEMIVDYEMTHNISIDDDCDFELDDEMVNEEEFLKITDQELDEVSMTYEESQEKYRENLFEIFQLMKINLVTI